MKKIINGFILGSLFTAFVVSAAPNDQTNLRIQDINLQTQHLQCEVDRLRAELQRLECQRAPVCPPRAEPCARRPLTPCALESWLHTSLIPPFLQEKCKEFTSSEAGFNGNGSMAEEYEHVWSPRNLLMLAGIGSTVTTSPYLGLRSAFDASDLIVNLPTMNEDLRFLKERILLRRKLACYGIRLPDRPIIELGGKIEGIGFVQEDYNNGPTRSDINLASARLDLFVLVSRAIQGFMAFNMDNSNLDLLNNSSLDVQLAGSQSRVFNSRVFVSRAFVTIGDLDCSPFYFSLGQMFVPFGRYASNMVTSPLTAELARTNERALLLGFFKEGVYGSVYTFRGEADLGNHGINQWGANLGYEKSWKCGSLNVGGGYIANIADATGFQVTGASSGFFGFSFNALTEDLVNRVPAYDVHGEFSLGPFSLFAEYIWATREFNIANLMFNDHGAKPAASNLELAYRFHVFQRPASIAAGYGTSREAFPLYLPRNSTTVAFNTSIWKNTIQSLEFRHDNNYDRTVFASGSGSNPEIFFSPGGSRNTVTLQVGIYF